MGVDVGMGIEAASYLDAVEFWIFIYYCQFGDILLAFKCLHFFIGKISKIAFPYQFLY